MSMFLKGYNKIDLSNNELIWDMQKWKVILDYSKSNIALLILSEITNFKSFAKYSLGNAMFDNYSARNFAKSSFSDVPKARNAE